MKFLIFLSLAGICLAKSTDRRAFLFPGQPNSNKNSNTLVWSEFGSLGSINPDSSNNEKSSDVPDVVLSNPHRRDVKLGKGFAVFGFHGSAKRSFRQSENNKQSKNNIKDNLPIYLNVKNPSHSNQVKSFDAPVLEKTESSSSEESNVPASKQEESSSSEESNVPASKQEESSSSEESNVPANNQEESSSSEESDAPAGKQEESSSSEESNAPAGKQEESSSSEESNAPAGNQDESLSSDSAVTNQEEPSASDESNGLSNKESTADGNSAQDDSKGEKNENENKRSEHRGLMPFVGAKPASHFLQLRNVDDGRPRRVVKPVVKGARSLRSVEYNIPDVGILLDNESSKNSQQPQEWVGGGKHHSKRVRRPAK